VLTKRLQNVAAGNSSFTPAKKTPPQPKTKPSPPVVPSKTPPEWAGASSFVRAPIAAAPKRSREVMTGNFTVATPDDLKKFEGITFLDGSLTVIASALTAADLAPLKSLARVSGNLTITEGAALGDLTGLSGLVSVGKNLKLSYSDGLTSLNGLQQLKSVGEFTLAKTNVTDLEPIANLEKSDGLWLAFNPALTDLGNLANVKMGGERVAFLQNPGIPAATIEKLTADWRTQGFTGEFMVDPGVHAPPLVPEPPPAAITPTPVPVVVVPVVPALPPIDPKTIRPADWTFFVHLNADNSLEPEAINDLNEMESVGSIPGKVNVIALVEGSGAYVHGRADWSAPAKLMLISKDPDRSDQIVSRQIAIAPDSELGKLMTSGMGLPDMADPKVLNAALRYVQDQVPAKHLLVDLWDHGNAWEGVSFSDRSGHNLQPANGDLATAFEGVKVDVLSADACMMATVEVAEAAQQLEASFLVGSEETEPGPGWNYTDVLGRLEVLFSRKAETSAEEVSRAIADSYGAGATGNSTMSVTNLKNLALVRTQLQTFGDALNQAGGLNANRKLNELYMASAHYAGDGGQIDLTDFARRVAAAFPPGPLSEAATRMIGAVKEVSYATSAASAGSPYREAGGLSIYAPTGAMSPAYSSPTAPWHEGSWAQFLVSRSLPVGPAFVVPDWAQPVPPTGNGPPIPLPPPPGG
jgi:hypothetical protein